ncbi:MAG: hypothetical protein ACRDZ4_04790, partial [Egibacteraceae bacterium]
AFLFAPALALGQATGPQPGATDPLDGPRGYALFRDDELFMSFSAASDGDNLRFGTLVPIDQFGSYDFNLKQVVEPWSTQSHQFFAARGRPLQPDRDHVVVAQRSGASDVLLQFFQRDQVQTYTLPNAAFAARALAPSSDFLDVAVGDLDWLPDSAGEYHDEVVVCWVTLSGGSLFPNIAVLDYTSPAANATPVAITKASASHFVASSQLTASLLKPDDNVVSIAIGDFDGDGRNEIAHAVLENSGSLWLTIFRYTNDGAGNRSLQAGSPFQIGPPGGWLFMATVDLAAADVDGDAANQDELLLGNVIWQNFNYRSQLSVYQANANLQLSQRVATDVAIDTVPSDTLDGRTRIQLVPGLFTYNPGAGFDFLRREVWVFRNTGSPSLGTVTGQLYTVSSPATPPPAPSSWTIALTQTDDCNGSNTQSTGQRWAATAGGLRYNSNTSDPRWWVNVQAIANSGDPSLPTFYAGYVINPFLNGCSADAPFQATYPFDPTARPAIAAYDSDGDSTILGPAVHIEAADLFRTDYVLQEPPKHTYWDGTTVQTVTRLDSFFVSVDEDLAHTYDFSKKATSGSNIGVSTELSAIFTAEEGKDAGIVQADATEKAHISGRLSYGYDRKKSSVDSQFASATQTIQGKAAASDWLQGLTQTYDIWRYRIYGTSFTDTVSGQPANGFYEVTIPGPVLPFSGDPANWDWYQPIYENGNILSYPQQLNPPLDVGTFDITAPVQVSGVPGILSSASLRYTDSSSESSTLAYDGTATASSTLTYSNSLKGSADVGGTLSENIKIPFVKETLAIHTNLSLNGRYSWGGTNTA